MSEGTNASAAYDVLLKILMIGDSESRKTELLHQYLDISTGDGTSTTLGESTDGENLQCRQE